MAQVVTTSVRKPGPYPKGRRCRRCPHGDRTVLSTYNPSRFCARHGGWVIIANGQGAWENRIVGELLADVLSG